jgi:hypothetical protein
MRFFPRSGFGMMHAGARGGNRPPLPSRFPKRYGRPGPWRFAAGDPDHGESLKTPLRRHVAELQQGPIKFIRKMAI